MREVLYRGVTQSCEEVVLNAVMSVVTKRGCAEVQTGEQSAGAGWSVSV